MRVKYPHECESLQPVREFFIKGKWLSLYYTDSLEEPYSFFWEDEKAEFGTFLDRYGTLRALGRFLYPDRQTVESSKTRKTFPHAEGFDSLKPVTEFFVNGRWISLYICEGYTECCHFNMYWNDEVESIQHNMSESEVFSILANFLNLDERVHI